MNTRMMLIDTEANAIAESDTEALANLLDARDVLVVNDAATLPASLEGLTDAGAPIEVRLLDAPYQQTVRAVLLGAGSYRMRTEDRPPPPVLAVGDGIKVGAARLVVRAVSQLSPRLVELALPGDVGERFGLVYRSGHPVQYSYVPERLALWDVQTTFAGRPWAVEMPSAARPLRASTLLALSRRGISIVSLTHAAGLSATGDEAIDRALPLPERYDIPPATVQAIASAKRRGGRVVAVGTTVVRALEDSAEKHGEVRAGESTAELVLGPETKPRVASGLLTGIHMPGESHYRLLSAFAARETLTRAATLARERQYRAHEFGDAALFLPRILARAQAA